jgi:hypothetical protein
MKKFKITIPRTFKEEYEMELEADQAIIALDIARTMTEKRNQTSTNGQYSVIEIEEMTNEQS